MEIRLPALPAALSVALLAAAHCMAWSPRVHALQTAQAKRLVPAGMARFLGQHESALMEAAGGVGNAAVPTPEAVEEQFHRILDMSEAGRPPREIAVELGRLANMAQLLTDPSATAGFTFVRGAMSAYADEHYKKLVAVREPLFAAKGGQGPRAAIGAWDRVKYERFRALSAHVDPRTGARVGSWDALSVPFAQMQLGFSAGVSATADLWVFAWRAAGDLWPPAP
jgi:hypothetical protein